MKKCSVCNKIKEFNLFNKDNRNSDGLQVKCKDCIKEYRLNNKHKREEWEKNNTEYYSQYYKKNKEKFKVVDKKKRSNYSNKYQKEKRKNDNLFRLLSNLRVRTSVAFSSKNRYKNKSIKEMLGIDLVIAKKILKKSSRKV